MDYKEKLRLAKEALESGSYDKETIEYIFPELKESEDKRIRKAIVKMISDIDGGFPFEKYGIIKKEVIAWLEKQGEKSHCNGEVNDEALQRQLQIWFDKGKCSGRDEVIFHPEDFGLQKQGEQKPMPREYADAFDEFISHIPEKEPEFSESCYNYDDMVAAVQFGINYQKSQKPSDDVEPKFKVKYAGNKYNVFEIRNINGIKYYGIEDEPNHINYIKADSCKKVDGYSIKENGSSYPTNPTVFAGQKPAWSEEDEEIIEGLNNCLDELEEKNGWRFTYVNGKNIELNKIRNWLKSIKDRIWPQPKREWNEEDALNLNQAIYVCHQHGYFKVETWLKSLKEE